MTDLQRRKDHWAIVDLIGKASRIRTIPVPHWAKDLIDDRLQSAGISNGRIFRRVTRAGTVWGSGLSEKVVWHVVRQYARKAGIDRLAPHDLRLTCAPLRNVQLNGLVPRQAEPSLQTLEKVHEIALLLVRQLHLEPVVIKLDDLIQRRCSSVVKIWRAGC